MNWSDAITPPKLTTLRQFAGLWLLFFGSLAGWRAWHGVVDARTATLGVLAVIVGGLGLVVPSAMRWIYTGWMVAAFPIGWTISRVMVAILFFLIFTPVALVFRLLGRDALRLRRVDVPSYWTAKDQPGGVKEYFRQF